MSHISTNNRDFEVLRDFLFEHLRDDSRRYYGVDDDAYIRAVTGQWFNDESNYDGRWALLDERLPGVAPVLDMAAGCGTFVIYGLRHGRDVWGIEPEAWKREYFSQKIQSIGLGQFSARIIDAVGEKLPFPDEHFAVVTSYQTMEHVHDVAACISEMLRVLRPGGVLIVQAPNYQGFYEPHYRMAMPPLPSQKLKRAYIRIRRKPAKGLETINWVTERQVLKSLATSNGIIVERFEKFYAEKRATRLTKLMPSILRVEPVVTALNRGYAIFKKARSLINIARRERTIDLWVTKI